MALAWGITRKRVVAYRVAGAGSLIVGAGFIVWGFLNFGSNGLALFAGYLGFVMISVGRQIPGQAGLRERLQRGTARDAMRPIGAIIAADSSLLDATERYLRPFPDQVFPVQEGGRIVGALSLDHALDYAASSPVGEAMIPFDDPPMIEDTEPLDDVVDWIGARERARHRHHGPHRRDDLRAGRRPMAQRALVERRVRGTADRRRAAAP